MRRFSVSGLMICAALSLAACEGGHDDGASLCVVKMKLSPVAEPSDFVEKLGTQQQFCEWENVERRQFIALDNAAVFGEECGAQAKLTDGFVSARWVTVTSVPESCGGDDTSSDGKPSSSSRMCFLGGESLKDETSARLILHTLHRRLGVPLASSRLLDDYIVVEPSGVDHPWLLGDAVRIERELQNLGYKIRSVECPE